MTASFPGLMPSSLIFLYTSSSLLIGNDDCSFSTPPSGSWISSLQLGHARKYFPCFRSRGIRPRHLLQKLWWHGSIFGSS